METVSLDLMGMSPIASPEEMPWRSPGTTCLEWDPDSPTCWSYDPKEVANLPGPQFIYLSGRSDGREEHQHHRIVPGCRSMKC